MQFARLAVRPHAVPVIQPIGYVARLLDFGNQQTRPDGVRRAGLDQHAIARLWLKLVQAKFAGAAFDLAGQGTAVEAARSYTSVPIDLDTLLANETNITAYLEPESDVVVACGDLGGVVS